MLEMNDNFEAAAALRQKVRDLKRIERKKVMGFNNYCIKPGFKHFDEIFTKNPQSARFRSKRCLASAARSRRIVLL